MPWKSSVTQEEVISFLNEALKTDPVAIVGLINTRVPCNAEMEAHPTIQVGRHSGAMTVGLLGILNGLFGIDERGYGPFGAIGSFFRNGDSLTIDTFTLTTEGKFTESKDPKGLKIKKKGTGT